MSLCTIVQQLVATREVQVPEPIMQVAAYPTQGRARVNAFAGCGKVMLALKRSILFSIMKPR